jgi:hypothetical protein
MAVKGLKDTEKVAVGAIRTAIQTRLALPVKATFKVGFTVSAETHSAPLASVR